MLVIDNTAAAQMGPPKEVEQIKAVHSCTRLPGFRTYCTWAHVRAHTHMVVTHPQACPPAAPKHMSRALCQLDSAGTVSPSASSVVLSPLLSCQAFATLWHLCNTWRPVQPSDSNPNTQLGQHKFQHRSYAGMSVWQKYCKVLIYHSWRVGG